MVAPIAPPDAQAAASYIVELLSPIAPPDALAAASFGSRLFGPRGHGDLLRRSIGDNRSTLAAFGCVEFGVGNRPVVDSFVEALDVDLP